jgi:excisionase family DNA binding protein
MSATEPVLFTLNEAANRLRIAPITLRGWCRAGKLAYHRIGHQMMISQSDLDDLIRSSRVAS